jgi:hypothetical protein
MNIAVREKNATRRFRALVKWAFRAVADWKFHFLPSYIEGIHKLAPIFTRQLAAEMPLPLLLQLLWAGSSGAAAASAAVAAQQGPACQEMKLIRYTA